MRSKRNLDEAPGAYKDIDEVMRQQQDLVEIEITLKPLGSIKA
jgi:tRNA-splicing ligase RtcB